MNKGTKYLILLLSMVILYACTTEKNTFVNRTFHNITSRFNGYFHAKQNLEQGKDQLVNTYQEKLNELLPVFPYGDEQAAIGIYSHMDKAIQKATKVITKHSMVFKIKGVKKPKEVVNWIDDAYLVIAQAHHFKREYSAAIDVYKYIAETYDYLPTKYDALIWNLKVYVDQKDEAEAYGIIKLLDEDKEFPEDRLAFFSAVKAQYYIDTEDYKLAIESLQKAAILEKNKFFRIRYNYLLAQLATKVGNADEAVRYYELVIKMNPPYDYAFNAKINMAKVYAGSNSELILKILSKMLKDEKNKDYLDQIYYAMAELNFKNGNEENGIDLLKKSIAHSTGNVEQKALAYHKLADYYFEQPNYITAQAYYDSTSNTLPSNHPDYDLVVERRNSLKEVVTQYEIIAQEDSLQRIVNMSESERLKFIDNLIQEVIDEEERLKEEQEKNDLLIVNDNSADDINAGGGNGEWYFANPSAMSVGKSDFIRIYGARKNEDNWRRSNKSSSGSLEDLSVNVGEEEGDDGTLSPNKTREYYLKNLPMNDSLLSASNARLVDAYFKLGMIYNEQLYDYNASVKTFEELLSRFKNSKYEAQVLYILYRLLEQKGKSNQANIYKTRILNEFPESEYAQIIRNPNLKKEQEENENKAKLAYEGLVASFKSGQYEKVAKDAEMLHNQYKTTSSAPEIFFLKALAKGHLVEKKKFRAMLMEVKEFYPTHRVANDAEDIIKRLDGVIIKEQAEKIDENSLFKLLPNNEHYFIILVNSKNVDLNTLTNSISDFNAKSFSLEKLKLKSIVWDENTQVVMVMGLKDLSKSISYFKAIQLEEFFKVVKEEKQVYFSIASENYITMFKEKNTEEYTSFFFKNYPIN